MITIRDEGNSNFFSNYDKVIIIFFFFSFQVLVWSTHSAKRIKRDDVSRCESHGYKNIYIVAYSFVNLHIIKQCLKKDFYVKEFFF